MIPSRRWNLFSLTKLPADRRCEARRGDSAASINVGPPLLTPLHVHPGPNCGGAGRISVSAPQGQPSMSSLWSCVVVLSSNEELPKLSVMGTAFFFLLLPLCPSTHKVQPVIPNEIAALLVLGESILGTVRHRVCDCSAMFEGGAYPCCILQGLCQP